MTEHKIGSVQYKHVGYTYSDGRLQGMMRNGVNNIPCKESERTRRLNCLLQAVKNSEHREVTYGKNIGTYFRKVRFMSGTASLTSTRLTDLRITR